jgi:hypothetical protein
MVNQERGRYVLNSDYASAPAGILAVPAFPKAVQILSVTADAASQSRRRLPDRTSSVAANEPTPEAARTGRFFPVFFPNNRGARERP